MTNPKEQIIIKNIVNGDVNAFVLLVNSYKEMAVLTAYNILLNREDAEEVAQDAFVKAYTMLSSYKAKAKFSSWLYRIVVNTALNKRKLKKYFFTEITEVLEEELPADINSIYNIITTAENKKLIQQALRSLNENERICITLYYLNELSVEEIHELTGISTANIKVLLYRGRKNLYTALHKFLKSTITNSI